MCISLSFWDVRVAYPGGKPLVPQTKAAPKQKYNKHNYYI